MGITRKVAAVDGDQVDGPLRVFVDNRLASRRSDTRDADLLERLPDGACLRRLAGLTLPAWEFPQAAEMLVRAPAGDENPPVLPDQSESNHQHGAHILKDVKLLREKS